MNVTIPDLAPLEDILVEEITEHERGQCESRHYRPRNLVCSEDVVAITHQCIAEKLVCSATVEYVRWCMSNNTVCIHCDEPCADCWSVVMLP